MTVLPLAAAAVVLPASPPLAVAVAMAVLVALLGWRLRRANVGARRLATVLRALEEDGRAATARLQAAAGDDACLRDLADAAQSLWFALRRERRQSRQIQRECDRRLSQNVDRFRRELGTWRNKAHRDALTGLGNRAALQDLLPTAVEQAKLAGRDLSIVMIDVDYLKTINDALGHPAGDAFLRDVGGVIRETLRETDGAFRYGGDEFVLLLPSASPEQARGMTTRLALMADTIAEDVCAKLPPGVCATRRPGLSCGVAAMSQVEEAGDAESKLGDAESKLGDAESELGDVESKLGDRLLAKADADCYRIKQHRRISRAA